MFSIQRAAEDTSQIRAYANAAGKPRKIDDMTVEFVTNGPNPIELEHLVTIFIMSKSWCEKNKAVKPLDFKNKEEMITARNANGTGAFSLKSREPDVKTHLVKNPAWWGWKDKKFDGNVDEIVYTPITNDATRLAALVAGNVDVINDPAPQDVPRLQQTPGIKVIEGVEQRIVFIGMDQARDELLYSSVKGKNPFKDKRVREALYQRDRHRRDPQGDDARPVEALRRDDALAGADDARDREALRLRPGRGEEAAGRRRLPERLRGAARLPEQPLRQRREDLPGAGAMWTKIGVNTRLVTLPRAQYFPKLEKLDTSLYMLGWGGASTDAIFTLQPVLSTVQRQGRRRLQLRSLHRPQVRRDRRTRSRST